MKVLKEWNAPGHGSNGRTRMTVELEPGEKLMVFKPDQHYELGEPLDMIVRGDHIIDSAPASWCALEQKWLT